MKIGCDLAFVVAVMVMLLKRPVEATFESDAEHHAGNNVKGFENDKRKEDMKEQEAEQEVRKILGLPPKEEKKRRDKQE